MILGDFARADRELGELLPLLTGLDEIEGTVARARSTLWTEQEEQTLALASRAVELTAERDAREWEGPALSMLSAAYGMRGAEGDLDAAREIGDRALVAWVPGTRPIELAEFYHLHADT